MWKRIAASILVACADPPPPAAPAPLVVPPLPPGTKVAEEPALAGPPPRPPAPVLTFEQALERSDADEVPPGTPRLTDRELSAPLRSATFVTQCGAPSAMKVRLRLVVHDGQALGVSIFTDPYDATIESCVAGAVRGFSWPRSPHYDSFTTTY